MVCASRWGLKQRKLIEEKAEADSLNGLLCPLGIETQPLHVLPQDPKVSEWSALPVGDSYENPGEGGKQEKSRRKQLKGERNQEKEYKKGA